MSLSHHEKLGEQSSLTRGKFNPLSLREGRVYPPFKDERLYPAMGCALNFL